MNIIVGENNSGKTALIDAIRYTIDTNSSEWIRIQESESFARLTHTFDFNIMDKIFQIQDSKRIIFTQIKFLFSNIRLLTSPILPQIEAYCPIFGHRAQLST